ncbi:hypothetical protein [Christiangramia portivictoriae]|uniref:hypothetical protein n=1 Tax=Christiangramia portivictoriae TaxID=326069 RepID=UPI0003FD4BA7|nr:hypothetical protein [Christiangramia portivictoriae]
MKNKELEEFFESVNFDIEEPQTAHRDRFARKLKEAKMPGIAEKDSAKLWIGFLSIAAVLALVLLLSGNFEQGNQSHLASISPEMRQTQEFYTGVIEKELIALNAEATPETQAIIQDALQQLKKLEKRYNKLEKDLLESGNDKRVIHAMIQNFQQRIDLLSEVLIQIENIKSLNNQNYESNTI